MSRYVRIDRRYKNPYQWTAYAYRVFFKWGFLFAVWIVLIFVSDGYAGLPATIALIWYAIHRYRVNHPRPVTAPPAYAPVVSAVHTARFAEVQSSARLACTPSRLDTAPQLAA